MTGDRLAHEPEIVLIKQAQDGSRFAFAELRRRHQKSVSSVICARIRDPIEAEARTNETFGEAWANIKTYRPEKGSFGGWLRGITCREIADYFEAESRDLVVRQSRRRRRRRGNIPCRSGEPPGMQRRVSFETEMRLKPDGSEGIADDSTPPTEATALDHCCLEAISAYRRGLPKDQDEAIRLVYGQGLQLKLAADLMGIPLGTVKTLVRRGLASLKNKFANGAERARLERCLAGHSRDEFKISKWAAYWLFGGPRPDEEDMENEIWLPKGKQCRASCRPVVKEG